MLNVCHAFCLLNIWRFCLLLVAQPHVGMLIGGNSGLISNADPLPNYFLNRQKNYCSSGPHVLWALVSDNLYKISLINDLRPWTHGANSFIKAGAGKWKLTRAPWPQLNCSAHGQLYRGTVKKYGGKVHQAITVALVSEVVAKVMLGGCRVVAMWLLGIPSCLLWCVWWLLQCFRGVAMVFWGVARLLR